ncbi:MAG: excinuclease ATPase subunit [Clostridia bacterium]|nr:excinuclease ATPase subunit [Clostridia bacterium]
MTWGPQMMCYICPECGQKFKYELGLLNELGPEFGTCPKCGAEGKLDHDGPRRKEDEDFVEVLG